MIPTQEPPPAPSEPPRSRPRRTKAREATPRTAPDASIPLPLPRLDCTLAWSPSAARVLGTLPDTKRELNAALRSAARLTLAVAPLYPALRALVENRESEARAVLTYTLDASWLSDAEMHELNREHRGKDRPTDVLSFPLWEGESFAPTAGEPLALGDLVLSLDTAVRQAGEQNHTLREEVAFLTIHGVLHLLGFDHAKDAGRRAMFRQQDALFEAWRANTKPRPPLSHP